MDSLLEVQKIVKKKQNITLGSVSINTGIGNSGMLILSVPSLFIGY